MPTDRSAPPAAERELPAPDALRCLLAAAQGLRPWRQDPLLHGLLREAARETRSALQGAGLAGAAR